MKLYKVEKITETYIFDGPTYRANQEYYTTSSIKANNKFAEWKNQYLQYHENTVTLYESDDEEKKCIFEREINGWDTESFSVSIKEIEVEVDD